MIEISFYFCISPEIVAASIRRADNDNEGRKILESYLELNEETINNYPSSRRIKELTDRIVGDKQGSTEIKKVLSKIKEYFSMRRLQ